MDSCKELDDKIITTLTSVCKKLYLYFSKMLNNFFDVI